MRQHLQISGAITNIYHYPIVGELFNSVGVAVAYFLWQKDYKGNTSYKRIENNICKTNRVVDLNRLIVSDKASNIVDKVTVTVDWASTFDSRSYPFMDQRKRFSLDDSNTPSEYYNVAVMANKEATVYTVVPLSA